jgi:hypothetical protein
MAFAVHDNLEIPEDRLLTWRRIGYILKAPGNRERKPMSKRILLLVISLLSGTLLQALATLPSQGWSGMPEPSERASQANRLVVFEAFMRYG